MSSARKLGRRGSQVYWSGSEVRQPWHNKIIPDDGSRLRSRGGAWLRCVAPYIRRHAHHHKVTRWRTTRDETAERRGAEPPIRSGVNSDFLSVQCSSPARSQQGIANVPARRDRADQCDPIGATLARSARSTGKRTNCVDYYSSLFKHVPLRSSHRLLPCRADRAGQTNLKPALASPRYMAVSNSGLVFTGSLCNLLSSAITLCSRSTWSWKF